MTTKKPKIYWCWCSAATLQMTTEEEALNNSHLWSHSSRRSQVLYGSNDFSTQGLTLKELATRVFSGRSGDSSNSELIQVVGVIWSLEVTGVKSCWPGCCSGEALICRPLALPCQRSFQKVVADNVAVSIKSPSCINFLWLFLLLPTTENL